MNFFKLIWDLRSERSLVSALSPDECRLRIQNNLSPSDLMGNLRVTQTRRFVGKIKGDHFGIKHRMFAPLTFAELSGRLRKEQGRTIISCKVGLSLRNYLGIFFLECAILATIFMIIRGVLFLEVWRQDVFIIAVQFLVLGAIGVGLPFLFTRDVKKNGGTLVDFLRDLLDATNAKPTRPTAT